MLVTFSTLVFYTIAAASDYLHREIPNVGLLGVIAIAIANLSQQTLAVSLLAAWVAVAILLIGFALWLVAPVSAGDVKWLSATPLVCTQPLGFTPPKHPSTLIESYELLFAWILAASTVNALYWLHHRDESNPAMIGITAGVIAWAFIPLAL